LNVNLAIFLFLKSGVPYNFYYNIYNYMIKERQEEKIKELLEERRKMRERT